MSLSVKLADSQTKLYAYSESNAAPVLLANDVTGSSVTLTAANVVNLEAGSAIAATRAIAETSVYWTAWNKQTVTFLNHSDWTYSKTGRPSYLLGDKIAISTQTLNLIDKALPKKGQFQLELAQCEKIEISESANVKLYFVSNSSARRNALAYFTYTGDVPTRAEINSSLALLYPNLSSSVLSTGEGVQLAYYDKSAGTWSDIFPAGTKIGFVLLIDTWNASNGTVNTTNQNVMYSANQYNSYTIKDGSSTHIMANRPQMAAFKAGDAFVLSFEDLPYRDYPGSPYMDDFADDIFIMQANPVKALPDVPEVPVDVPIYSTSLNFYGMLAYEDNWPYKGDYNLNDVMVSYNSSLHLDPSFAVNSIEETYTFTNNGGQYTNGFGIEYGFDLSTLNLSQCKVVATTPAGATLPVPGFDSGSKKALMMLFNDAKTIPAGTTFKVTLVFNSPISFITYRKLSHAYAPYNPFITVNATSGELRKEVHPVDYTPTYLANTKLFGTGADLSNGTRYYVSDASYPFAIDLSSVKNFIPAKEGQAISKSYPKFDSWVSSNGANDTDWYLK